MKRKAQLVIWRDCTGYDLQQMSADEVGDMPLIEMHTIGHLIREDRISVDLGMDYIPEQQTYRHISKIPKVNIVRRVTLTL